MFSLFKLSGKNQFLYCYKPHSAYLYYKSFRIDLLTGRKENYSWSAFYQKYQDFTLKSRFLKPKVIHFYYEFGYLCNDLEHLVADHQVIAIEIDYLKSKKIHHHFQGKDIGLKFTEVPSYEGYEESFNKVKKHLLHGDCYQVNLTRNFYFKFQKKFKARDFVKKFLSQEKKLGRFAHLTYLSSIDSLLISNSPECLFRKKLNPLEIYSMPIKGSIASGKNFEKSWENLVNNKKEQGELNMITDLIRNDLSRLDEPKAKVVSKSLPLQVPQITHQYSLISTSVRSHVSWEKILRSIFPGGSITGAPKKYVMEVIKEVESEPRGFYCGSTFFATGDQFSASINIRSAEIDFERHEVKYGAGGGVTLLSDCESEYKEMVLKVKSFYYIFNS